MNMNRISCREHSFPEKLPAAPLVSVMMITYLHAPYIRQAIESIVSQQTNFPFELVIGEDCSPDDTMAIILELQKKYPHIIRILYSESNVGMNDNAFRTALHCRGEYTAFCEGDDFWLDSLKLQKEADYLNAHSDCGLCFGNLALLNNATGRMKYNTPIPGRLLQPDFRSLFSGNRISTCTAMVRTGLYHQWLHIQPPVAKNWLAGDLPLYLYIAALNYKIHGNNEYYACYRVLDNSATHGNLEHKIRFYHSIAKIKLWFSRNYAKSEYSEQIIFHYAKSILRIILQEGIYSSKHVSYVKKLMKHVKTRKRRFLANVYYQSLLFFAEYVPFLFPYLEQSLKMLRRF